MSGLKYSTVEILREIKMRQEALTRIKILKSSIQTINNKIDKILREIPKGVKDSFSKDIEKIKEWQSSSLPSESEGMRSSQLSEIEKRLKAYQEEGKALANLLLDIKERRRGEKERELVKELERIEAEVSGMENLLKKWKPDKLDIFRKFIAEIFPMIEKGDFVKAEERIEEVEREITKMKEECESLEIYDNERKFILDKLRIVCRDMGWDEIGEPHLEKVDNPGSPLIYEVNTYSSGIMKFYLTLKGIKVDSPFSPEKDFCYKQFDSLSEKLKDFGVQTKFERLSSPEEEPSLIRKGELDLPEEGEEREESMER